MPLPDDWPGRIALDLAHVWHPFTQMREHDVAPPIPVIRGEGCDLVLWDGRRVLDGVSSWWTNVHGHAHPRIVDAIARQAATLDHVLFAGFTHEPALEVIARLRPRLPAGLTRCFFSDDGSTAVEVALKMTFQAQAQRGRGERTRIGALEGAYHGDTLGAVGVGDLENFMTRIFQPLLLACDRVAVPRDPRRDVDPGAEALDLTGARGALGRWFDAHGPHLAAFVAEPLVQGAGGMLMWPAELLVELRALCDEHGVYLILDEVMTGFGRTGRFLACDEAGVMPDVLCLSKGLTGGTLPLALTCATEALYEVFLGDVASGRAFLHGHSYTANPIACAAAAASLALFDETPALARGQALGEKLRAAWGRVSAHPSVRRARTAGGIAACDLVDRATAAPRRDPARDALAIHRAALDRGLLVRPIGGCLYLMPPLATPLDRVDAAVDAIVECLDEVL